jgi:hypothetical protein
MKHLIAAVSLSAIAVPAAAMDLGAPFEQNELDRTALSASAGSTVQDRAVMVHGGESVWADDANFIAPPR